MASALDIANRALSRLGDYRISAYPAVAADGKPGRAVNAAFTLVRDEVLADHPWNRSTKRAVLAATQKTITGATAASPVVVTSNGHGLANGTFVVITGVVGMTQLNGNRYKLANVAANTFELQTVTGVNVDGSAYTAYSSGGTATVAPAWGYGVQFDLPSDCLRVLELESQAPDTWLVESGKLVTDLASSDSTSSSTTVAIRYIWQNTDVTTYDPLLVSAFSARLAAEMAEELTNSSGKRELAWGEYGAILSRAKGADAREQTPAAIGDDTWITCRY